MSGARTAVIDAPIDTVWQKLLAFDTYPQWQASVLSSSVLELDDEGRASLVQLKVDAKFKNATFRIRPVYDYPSRLAWEFVDGDIEDAHGDYALIDNGDGTTTVAAEVAFTSGYWVPSPLKDAFDSQGTRLALDELKTVFAR